MYMAFVIYNIDSHIEIIIILGISGARPVATEEQLSADFRKKLEEWKLKKGVKQPLPVPARQDLSEDFLRRWGKFSGSHCT